MSNSQNVGEYPGPEVKDEPFILRVELITESGDRIGDTMEDMLDFKREDHSYEDVKHSLETRGFVRPVSVTERMMHPGQFEIHDGNHRLAAAIDLGWGHVLAAHYSGWDVSNDSGMWQEGDEIPTLEEAS